MMKKEKTLLLDLDHTIIRPQGNKRFPKDEDDWEFVPGVLDKLKEYADTGYRMFIVSNQAGIERGYTTRELFTNKANKIMELCNQAGADILNCVFCPSIDEAAECRKPNTGMFSMLDRHYSIDKAQAMMVGDMDTDETFAENLGIKYMHIDEFLKSKPE